MKALFVFILILTFKLPFAQKPPVPLEGLEKQTFRLAWQEQMGESGMPSWRRLTQFFFEYKDKNHLKINDSLARVISYDLVIYYDNNYNDSLIFHIANSNFSKDYSFVVKKMVPGTSVLITNIHCWAKWRSPQEFIYQKEEDEILTFRNL